jgi:hypothetical protein
MALAQGMQTHGHSVQIENPESLSSIVRTGYYIQAVGKPGANTWFHFAIPTPVIVNDTRLKIQAVSIRFKCGSDDVRVNNVHVFDGETQIAKFENLGLNPTNWSDKWYDVPGIPALTWAVGISVNVAFGAANKSHEIDFSSAGFNLGT